MGYAEGTAEPWWVGVEPGDARRASRPLWMDEVDEILEVTGTDWEVLKAPAQIVLPDGRVIEAANFFGVVRSTDNAVLGMTSDRYALAQNRVALEMLVAIAKDARLPFETGGSIRGGKLVWYQARIPQELIVAGDPHHVYVGIALGHDGNFRLKPFTTVTRIVCNNTFKLAEQTGNFVEITHSGDMAAKVQQASVALGLVHAATLRYAELGDYLQSVDLAEDAIRTAEKILFPEPRHPDPKTATPAMLRGVAAVMTRREDRLGKFRGIHAEEVSLHGPTAWSGLQSFFGYADHVKAAKVDRFDASIFGDGHAFKKVAMETISEMAGVPA